MGKVILNKDRVEAILEVVWGLNLLGHAQILELEVGSRCGGQGECGTCRMQVLRGEVSLPTRAEEEILGKTKLQEQWRLSCQCFPQGDGDIEAVIPS